MLTRAVRGTMKAPYHVEPLVVDRTSARIWSGSDHQNNDSDNSITGQVEKDETAAGKELIGDDSLSDGISGCASSASISRNDHLKISFYFKRAADLILFFAILSGGIFIYRLKRRKYW